MKCGTVNQWAKRRAKYVFREIDERSQDGQETLLSVSEYYGVRPRSESFGDAEFLSRAETLEGYKKCAAGDLVINIMLAWKRGLGVTPVDGIVSPAYNVFRLRQKDTCPAFFNCLLRTDEYVAEFTRRSTGIMASRLRMYPDAFMDVRVDIPPPSEQWRIAGYLDKATGKVDRLLALRRRQMELLREQRAALIQQAVTRGLDSNAPLKDSGLHWLGEIPRHWRCAQLRRFWDILDCKHVTVPFLEEGYRLASVMEVRSFELDLVQAMRTSEEYYKLLIDGGRQPKRGDVIYCRNTANTGTSAYVDTDEPIAMGQDVCLIKSRRQNGRYANYILHCPFMAEQLNTILVGSTFKRINVAEIKSLMVVCPPRREQDQIVKFIESKTAKLDRLLSAYTHQLELLTEYRAALIHECVTGQRAVPEASETTNPRN